jgi:tRNA(fMet)-specific endonuclease VapC
MILFDTDTLGYLQRGLPRLAKRYSAAPRHELATTVVNQIEILKARYDAILKAANAAELRTAQHWLGLSEQLLAEWRIIPIDELACQHFETRRSDRSLRKIGRADLLIACIALAQEATLVTRNVRDFKLVPRLKVENWMD